MGILQRVVGLVLGLLFLAAVFVFTSLVLGILLAVGLVMWVWLWWRGRSLPKGGRRGGTVIIEGEFRDVTDSQRIEDRDRR